MPKLGSEGQRWYSVRRLIQLAPGMFEERLTIWIASSPEEAIQLFEVEVAEYVEAVEADKDLGLAQVYVIGFEGEQLKPITPGEEIFSLVREVEMDADSYISKFFDTGREYQGQVE